MFTSDEFHTWVDRSEIVITVHSETELLLLIQSECGNEMNIDAAVILDMVSVQKIANALQQGLNVLKGGD